MSYYPLLAAFAAVYMRAVAWRAIYYLNRRGARCAVLELQGFKAF